jgi:DNA-binding NarL/FixJ family response regulator
VPRIRDGSYQRPPRRQPTADSRQPGFRVPGSYLERGHYLVADQLHLLDEVLEAWIQGFELRVGGAGHDKARLEALEIFETLGATAVAAKLRRTMRKEGIATPRDRGRDTRRHTAGLTARQAEALQLLDEGLTNTEIADRLFVSPRTVETHVSAVLTKLGSSTREEAVARARADGLVSAG